MCFKSEIAVLMQWVSLTFSRRLGSSEWLLDRRLTAVSLNNWKRETHFGDLILLCQGKEAVCRYLMARLFSLTSLPVGETATSWYLTVSAVGSEILATLTFFSMAFSSPFSFSSALVAKCRPGRSKASAFYRLFYHQCSRLCRMTGWRRPPPWRLHRPPPPCSWKDPRKTMRFDAVIRLLRKLCFSDVIYLVLCRHPVMMTCHSSLLCALYLYMIRLLFHCISLDLSPIFFCAIPATNEKIKKRNILCAVSNTFSVA